MSDNGAAAEDFFHHLRYGPFIRSKFNEDYERMGKADSFISYGPQWAEAGSAPFLYFKGYTTQGGMTAPMIISGPTVKRRNEISHEFLSLIDLAPTFYELAGVSYPERFLGREIRPLKGESLLPYLKGNARRIHDEDYVFAVEHYNYAMLRKGKWKITNIERPFDQANFKLYDLSTDLAELRDLKEIETEIFKELMEEWEAHAREIQMLVPTPDSD